jgi:hypothetical protein
MNTIEVKELKLRFKKNAKENELWIDPCFNNNYYYQDLLNLFGEPELYTYEHQFNQELGERILHKHPSKGFLVYRVLHLLDKDNGSWIMVNGNKILFNYELQRVGRSATINYKLNNGRELSVKVKSFYSSEMIVRELLHLLIKEIEQ